MSLKNLFLFDTVQKVEYNNQLSKEYMTKPDKTIEALKQAVIMEHRGKAMYTQVADQTKSSDVEKIFRLMADEEQVHIDFLQNQYASYLKTGTFNQQDFEESVPGEQVADLILTDSIRQEISGAGFEAAAISAAIDMESKSVEAYARRAAESADPNEKALYEWLSNWEKGHHKMLLELNRQLTEKIWNDNNFWPF